jgi:two-component system heavy metal sensor histidine kinase CusS
MVLVEGQRLDRAGVEQEVFEEAEISSSSPSPFFLRVLDRRNRVIVETPGMGTMLPPPAFREPSARGEAAILSASGGRLHLLRASTVVPAGSPQGGWHIQAALNVSAEVSLLARYRRDIGFTLAAGLLAAVVIGAGITRRGLKPIAQITRATEHMDVQKLQERIGTHPWPKELTALSAAFDRMLDRLQDSFERLSQFSADLAHELRTPINNLMGEAQVTLSRPRNATEYLRVLHSALEEYGRLARMIDSMLFLAQAERSRVTLESAQLEVSAELRAVADFYQAVADEGDVTLSCEGRADLVADPLLLRRAVSNLLSNALKYTPAGGTVILRAQAAQDGRAIVSIIDSGVGIAPEHLPKLADRFYRVDPSRTGIPGGAGLGLAIVKSIMDLHGGMLAMNSSPGTGTMASLIFPPAALRERRSA